MPGRKCFVRKTHCACYLKFGINGYLVIEHRPEFGTKQNTASQIQVCGEASAMLDPPEISEIL